jgi:FkbM family methyltransferase
VTRIVDEQKREIQVVARLASLSGQRILDIGCGDGRLALQMAEVARSVVAFDPDADAVAEARRRAATRQCANVSFQVDAVNTVAGSWSPFDVVVFSRSL